MANQKTASFLFGQLENRRFLVRSITKQQVFWLANKNTAGFWLGQLGNSMFFLKTSGFGNLMFYWTKYKTAGFHGPIKKQQVFLVGQLGNSMSFWFLKPQVSET